MYISCDVVYPKTSFPYAYKSLVSPSVPPQYVRLSDLSMTSPIQHVQPSISPLPTSSSSTNSITSHSSMNQLDLQTLPLVPPWTHPMQTNFQNNITKPQKLTSGKVRYPTAHDLLSITKATQPKPTHFSTTIKILE
jgi:hypothetical protein